MISIYISMYTKLESSLSWDLNNQNCSLVEGAKHTRRHLAMTTLFRLIGFYSLKNLPGNAHWIRTRDLLGCSVHRARTTWVFIIVWRWGRARPINTGRISWVSLAGFNAAAYGDQKSSVSKESGRRRRAKRKTGT
jgi:hypothetical protein